MKIIGLTDEVTTCDCCGKKNLKKTAVMENEDDGIVFYGLTCAATVLSYNVKFLNGLSKAVEVAKKYRAKYNDRQLETVVFNMTGYGTKINGDTLSIYDTKNKKTLVFRI